MIILNKHLYCIYTHKASQSLNDNIGTRMRQMRFLNIKNSNNNQATGQSINSVRQVIVEGKKKNSELNNFNFDNSKNNSENKKQTDLSSTDIHSKDHISLNKVFKSDNSNRLNISKVIKNSKQKTQPTSQSTIGNMQQRIRTYSQETLKNNKIQFKLPDVEDYNLQIINRPSNYFRINMQSKRSSMVENSSNSPSKDINFQLKYVKIDLKIDPKITYRQRIEQMDKNWQQLLQENDFI